MNTLLLAALLGCPPTSAVPVEPAAVPASAAPNGDSPMGKCLATWSMGKGASVLSEQRGLPGVDWNDFGSAYAAAAIDASHTPVKATAQFTVDGAPMLFFTQDGSQAVVDSRVFSDLTVVDVTALSAGAVAKVGTFLARGKLGHRALLEFLVRSDVIRTWAHLESEVCLTAESEGDPIWRAEFTGEHTYFTNRENHGALAFVVEVAGDGTITVTGR